MIPGVSVEAAGYFLHLAAVFIYPPCADDIYMKIRGVFLQCVVFFSFIYAAAAGQPLPVTIAYPAENSSWRVVERSDLSRYVNGKYTGLTRREVRSYINPSGPAAADGSRHFSGSFFVLEDTLRDMRKAARGVSGIVESSFSVSSDGEITMDTDNGYPSYRGFPVYPSGEVFPGQTWTGETVRSVDPLNKGVFTKMDALVSYVYEGEDAYQGKPVHRIAAKWAVRYREKDPDGDPELSGASGTHDAVILVDRETGAAVLITDRLDETFTYADGTLVRFRGSTLQFTDYPPAVNRERLLPALQRIASVPAAPDTAGNGVSPGSGIVIEDTPSGLRLSVRGIRFEADSAVILPSEKGRLDEIAAVLKTAPGAEFLVEGHTASVGRPEGEMTLSAERAKRVADELTARGIPADSFLFAGYGGTRPVASNGTEEGRALNRRVEITILE